jgi:hypothetical protein
MKRLIKFNSLVAIAFLVLWILLVVVEVEIRLYSFLSYIFFASLPLVFLAFFFASWRALRDSSKHPAGFAALTSVVMSPVFIFVGVTLVTNFKLLIGGHI